MKALDKVSTDILFIPAFRSDSVQVRQKYIKDLSCVVSGGRGSVLIMFSSRLICPNLKLPASLLRSLVDLLRIFNYVGMSRFGN